MPFSLLKVIALRLVPFKLLEYERVSQSVLFKTVYFRL